MLTQKSKKKISVYNRLPMGSIVSYVNPKGEKVLAKKIGVATTDRFGYYRAEVEVIGTDPLLPHTKVMFPLLTDVTIYKGLKY